VIRARIGVPITSPGLAREEIAVEQNASDLLTLAWVLLGVLILPVGVGLIAALREDGDS
jgi:hypothetical protein